MAKLSLSLHEFANGRFGTPRALLVLRCVSLLVHACVFTFGLRTRRQIFWSQFTNWTHSVTGLYSIFAVYLQVCYFAASAESRQKPHRFATFSYRLLSLFGPMHIVVSSTYWPTCWRSSQKASWEDYVYLINAHSVTLGLLFVEKNLQGFRATKKRQALGKVLGQLCFIFVYGLYGMWYARHFGASVYKWMDGLALYYYLLFVPVLLVANRLFKVGAGLFQ